jgi:hypothetical protein
MPSIGPVILINSCKVCRDHEAFVRATWLTEWHDYLPYKFLLGRGNTDPKDDELIFDVPDDYDGVPYKINAARRWATEQGFDFSFMCDLDTYIIVPRLLESDFETHDYVGSMMHDDFRQCKTRNIGFAQGGAGYWLSPKSAAVIERSEVQFPGGDVHVGDNLCKAGIEFTHDQRYFTGGYRPVQSQDMRSHPYPPNVITIHLSIWYAKPKYKPEWMLDVHKLYLEGRV